MRPSGTAGLWMLLLFGSACGDSVVVARGVSLVSAAVEASDAGLLDDARAEDSEPSFESGHGGTSTHHPPPSSARPPSSAHESASGDGGAGGGTSTSEKSTGGTGGTSSSAGKHH